MCAEAVAHDGVDHRRHRPRAHRQGRRLPARRDEPQGLPGDLPHGGHPRGGLAPAARTCPPARTRSTSTPPTEKALQDTGYIIGQMQRVIFYEPGVKETNWSATRPVHDTTGKLRRWVYLHYFKSGQPSINWLDPTCSRNATGARRRHAFAGRLGLGRTPAGRQRFPRGGEERRGTAGLVRGAPVVPGGQPAHRQHGAQGRRLHLPGTEPDHGRHQGHLGGRARPVLRLHHPAGISTRLRHRRHRFLRLTLREAMRIGIDQAVARPRLAEPRRDDLRAGAFRHQAQGRQLHLRRSRIPGSDLAEHIRQTLRDKLTEPAADYNLVFTTERNRLHHGNRHRGDTRDRGSRCGHRRSRSGRSARRICCWRCTTPSNPACSPSPAGTCAAS